MDGTKTAETLARLEAGVADLTSSEAWQAWLETAGRFHHYSFGNQLLIALARPDATRVAGFYAWRDLGRFVRKGEHGIAILAPMVLKSRETPPEGEDPKTFLRFRVVYVFDVSQTDGEPLPEIPVSRLEGDGAAFSALEAYAVSLGYAVTTAELPPEVNGETRYADSTITLAHGLSGAQRTKTLAHELGHAVLHAPPDGATREVRELEAESVAFVVCAALGIVADGYSFGYLASWGADTSAIRASGGRIAKTAESILEALEADEAAA